MRVSEVRIHSTLGRESSRAQWACEGELNTVTGTHMSSQFTWPYVGFDTLSASVRAVIEVVLMLTGRNE